MTGTTTTAPLYMPYKTVGLVCDKAPYFVNRLGSETFLTVPIGNCFQVFKVDRLAAVLVSKPAPGPISCLQVSLLYSGYYIRLIDFLDICRRKIKIHLYQ